MTPLPPPLRLVQILDQDGTRGVAKVDAGGNQLQVLADTVRIYDLALEAGRTGATLEAIVTSRLGDEWVDYDSLIATQRLLPPSITQIQPIVWLRAPASPIWAAPRLGSHAHQC
jgi:hypothetical protein